MLDAQAVVFTEEDMDRLQAVEQKLDRVLENQQAQDKKLSLTDQKLDTFIGETKGDHDKLIRLEQSFKIHMDEYKVRKQNVFAIWLAILGIGLGLVAEGVILIVKLL